MMAKTSDSNVLFKNRLLDHIFFIGEVEASELTGTSFTDPLKFFQQPGSHNFTRSLKDHMTIDP